MKIYGSINNRFDENKYYNGSYGNLKDGTPCTIYLWSDRHAHEVIKVLSQEDVVIRKLKATRIDGNGMSDSQTYLYESDPSFSTMRIRLKNGKWRQVETYLKDDYIKDAERIAERNPDKFPTVEAVLARWAETFVDMGKLTPLQSQRFLEGEKIEKLGAQVNISFGIADEYYDYSF